MKYILILFIISCSAVGSDSDLLFGESTGTTTSTVPADTGDVDGSTSDEGSDTSTTGDVEPTTSEDGDVSEDESSTGTDDGGIDSFTWEEGTLRCSATVLDNGVIVGWCGDDYGHGLPNEARCSGELVEGEACGNVNTHCCDQNLDLWFCWEDVLMKVECEDSP